MYIYEQKNWPQFTWDGERLGELLAEVRYLQGHLIGRMTALGFSLRQDASLQTLTQDVIKTSEIENEKLNRDQVRSSIARKLGIDINGAFHKDRNVEGIVNVMLDATRNYLDPLTKERLFYWHEALFSSKSDLNKIIVGEWRTKESGPMQIISGAYGREKIHYEAPDYSCLKKEMFIFLKWFEKKQDIDPVLKAALAHFWFVTIHPFDDGNGRIARAITDLQLSRSEKSAQRFYSMSSQIQKERKDYYDILEKSQKGTLDITVWMEWFLSCLKRSIKNSEELLEVVLIKAQFWEKNSMKLLNDRQRLMLNHLLDNFEGKLTSSRWAKMAKCSQDTAGRDINDLIDKDILIKDIAGGRNTNYRIK